MNAYIVFASGRLDASIINCLDTVGFPELIGYSRGTKGAAERIVEERPQLIIIDSREAANQTSNLMRRLQNNAGCHSSVVVLGVEPMLNDAGRHMGTPVHYFQFPEEETKLRLLLGTR
jgi:hypothetical protein